MRYTSFDRCDHNEHPALCMETECVAQRTPVQCPDCKVGTILPLDRCTGCGLSWEALEDAAAFFDKVTTR